MERKLNTVTILLNELICITPEASQEAQTTRLCLIYFGHFTCSLKKSMMLGMVSGTRRIGKQRTH